MSIEEVQEEFLYDDACMIINSLVDNSVAIAETRR